MGSIMKIQLLNDRLTFEEFENDEKIYVNVFVFLLLHIYRTHLSPPVRKMFPVLDVPLMGENIIFLSNKTCQVLIFENIHITKSYMIKVLVNIWNHGKNLQNLSSQNLC